MIVWYYRGFKISFFDLVVIEEVTKSSVFCKVQGDERSAGFGNAWSWVEKHGLWGLFQNLSIWIIYVHKYTQRTKTAQKKFSVQRERRSFHSHRRFKAYMFGVHIGAFHGGVMRIENTEITRSGQVEGANILAESLSGTLEIRWTLVWNCYDSMYRHVSCIMFSCYSSLFPQAANFGRYSSHWHVLSPHRTVDVADIASLLVKVFDAPTFFKQLPNLLTEM